MTARRWALAVTAVGVVAAVGTAVAGFVLTEIYRPYASGVEEFLLHPSVRRSIRWSDWHERASLVLLVATVMTVPLVYAARAHLRGARVAGGAAVLAVVLSVVTILTRPLVEWDQLALSEVEMGASLGGHWDAAFGDKVLHILVDGSEVSQGQYVPALLVHLGAPVAGAVALAIVAAAALRRPAAIPDER